MAPECTLENIQPRTIKPEEEAREVGGAQPLCFPLSCCLRRPGLHYYNSRGGGGK